MNVLDLAADLIRFPTPNPPGEERPLAEFLATWLEGHGLEAEVLPVGGAGLGQANVFARLRGSGSGGGGGRRGPKPLVFCGHLDTVPPGEDAWTRAPYRPTVDDGRLYGLGAADMKGAVAAMAVAAARLAAEQGAGRRLEGDLLLAFTSGEETRSLGAQAFAASGLLDGAAGLVIGEPTGNRVGIAEKGGIWLDLILNGHTAHGSLPHLGANAVAGMAEALVALDNAVAPDGVAGGGAGAGEASEGAPAALRRAMTAPEHPFLGRPTLTPTRLAGGVANNVVPDRASATLDIRTLPGQSHAAIRAGVEAVVAEVARRRRLRPAYVDQGDRPPLATAEDHPLIVACADAVRETLDRPPAYCGLTGATDATEIVPRLGLPFVICGPADMAQAHQPDEFVAVDALLAAVEIYYRLARRLCGD
jgi:succinyl-diaminopimelate desuccinylase